MVEWQWFEFESLSESIILQDAKPARNHALRTSLLIGFVVLAGCQQNPTRPPIVDVPRPATEREYTEAAIPRVSPEAEASENVDVAATRPKQRWENRLREIGRTELSDTTDSPPIPGQLPGETLKQSEETPQRQLDLARLDLQQNAPENTVQRINEIDFSRLNRTERAQSLRLKADSLRQLNLTIAALRVDAERLDYLDAEARDTEIRTILREVEQLPPLIRGDLASGTDHLAGLTAAWILREAPEPEQTARWLRKFTGHPLLASQLADYAFLRTATAPDTFAVTVLLPLSGELANAGRAIRDGLLYSFNQQKDRLAVELTIQDSNTLSSQELRQIASGESTEFIIGPLQRDKIRDLLRQNPTIPVLALNRLDDFSPDATQRAPVYSLSLAIEDDAETAVDYAGTEFVHPRLLTLYADSGLGNRAATAIKEQLKRIGGTDAGQFSLDSKKPETTISQALGVTDSLNRRRELSRTLNLALEHTPRTRQDLSTVVVQTDALGARQLRPLLDFYYLENTPVLFIGAFRSDVIDMTEDFKRSKLLATPWELNSKTRETLGERPLAQGPFGALTAIGKDAYDMALRLGFGEPTEFSGETGYLRLGSKGLIERRLGTMNIDPQERVSYTLWQPQEAVPILYLEDGYAR